MDHLPEKPKIHRFWVRSQRGGGGLFRQFVRQSDHRRVTAAMNAQINQLKAREARLLKKLNK